MHLGFRWRPRSSHGIRSSDETANGGAVQPRCPAPATAPGSVPLHREIVFILTLGGRGSQLDVMIRPVAAEKPKKKKRSDKRGWRALLVFVLLFYAALFAGIYVFAGGVDWRRALFGGTYAAALSKERTSSSAQVPEETPILPPLDDLPRDEWSPPPSISLPTPSAASSTEKTPAASLPPPKAIPGVNFVSKLLPIKCWDDRGFEYSADKCDALRELARLIEANLDMVDGCRTELTDAANTGSLAAFAEVDFVRNRFTLWPGTASTLRSADRIAECATDRFQTLSLEALPHQFVRYRIKGAVRFSMVRPGAVVSGISVEADHILPSRTAEFEKAAETAEEVAVSRERVRVRKTPVSGEIIGFISAPQRVKLLQIADEWCLVKTGRGNVGWMICWGLDLPGQAPPPTSQTQNQK